MTDTARQQAPSAISVTIDGLPLEARPGDLIIEAADRAGIYIPRFCYHPRMDPVGMCRMCLVEVSGPRGFSLQPACYLRVVDGQEVRTASDKARKAQEGVLEFLLINHPLDCPVCDKGGECPLQDQALSHGPGESRFVEEKRHWEKPIEIGPLVYLDRERCIQCARCTRFAAEVAGEALIDFAFRGDQVEVAPFPGRPFSSYFSGNTVQICPVGALTAVPYRFKSRPWDLEQVETSCTTCALGCRVAAQSSAGQLVRYLGVDSEPVNQSWLCDKGRYGFESVHASSRLTVPLLRRGDELAEATWNEALGAVVASISGADEPSCIGVIGGARLTNEDAYVWSKLAKSVLKTDSVDAQIGDGLPAKTVLGLPRATFEDALSAKAVILLAPDLREELPVLFLRLREAALTNRVPIIECSAVSSALSEHAAVRLGYEPGEAARLVAALVGTGEFTGPEPQSLERARELLEAGGADEGRGSGVVIVLGRASLAESGETIAAAGAILHDALPGARFISALRRANVQGALDMGLAPGVLPGRVGLEEGREWYRSAWGALPETSGRDTEAMLRAAVEGQITTLILLGADPLADFPDRALASEALHKVPFLVALATHHDASNALADVVLPAAGEGERVGTTTSCEGRVTRLARKVVPPGVAWPAWTVAAELARRLGADLGFDSEDSVSDDIAAVVPSHRGVSLGSIGRADLRDGVVIPLAVVPVAIKATTAKIDPMATPGILSVEEQGAPLSVGATMGSAKAKTTSSAGDARRPTPLAVSAPVSVPHPPRRDAYSHRLVVRRSLYDNGTLVAASPSLASLAPDQVLVVHPSELERLGVPSGGRLRVRSPRGELEIETLADAGLPRSVVVMAANVAPSGRDAGVLIDAGTLATDVRLETI